MSHIFPNITIQFILWPIIHNQLHWNDFKTIKLIKDNTAVINTIQQLVFHDTKLWGLSKINFKLNLLLRMSKLVVSNRIYKFEDKFFRGSVNIHKNPQNLLCWEVSHLILYNGEIDIAQQECKSCLPVVDAIRLIAADSWLKDLCTRALPFTALIMPIIHHL